MTKISSACNNSYIYTGYTQHVRLLPSKHVFQYDIFSVLLNLEEAPHLAKKMKLFSYNRFNLFSFYDKDHGDHGKTALKQWAIQQCEEMLCKKVDCVKILCFPRLLGYVFNPISVFFCYYQGTLQAVIYEVRNAVRHQHCYIQPVDAEKTVMVHTAAKKMFVSPFMPMDTTYHFRVRPPAAKYHLAIRSTQNISGKLENVQFATHHAVQQPLNDRMLVKMAIVYFASSFKVTVRIGWQAFRLWCKGFIYQKSPPPPQSEISL